MHCKYAPRDLQARLHGSVCRFDNHPYVVIVDGERAQVRLHKLQDGGGGKAVHTIDPNDPRFDISTPPLGYVNFPQGCTYLVRGPVRRYKQGIDTNNTKFYGLPNSLGEVQINRTIPANLFSKEVEKMILDDYPSPVQAIRKLRDGSVPSIACCREVAFKVDAIGMISVYFRNSLVGHILPDTLVVQVPNNESGWIVSSYLSGLGMEVK